MIKILGALLVVTLFTNCGYVSEVTCYGVKSDLLCALVSGSDKERIDRLQERDMQMLKDIAELERKQVELLTSLLEVEVTTEGELNNLQAQINNAYLSIGDLAAQLQNLPYSTVSIVDPCPLVSSNKPKEMLINVDGRIFAYFEQGNKRHLAELTAGVTYQTTDHRACQFTIDNL